MLPVGSNAFRWASTKRSRRVAAGAVRARGWGGDHGHGGEVVKKMMRRTSQKLSTRRYRARRRSVRAVTAAVAGVVAIALAGLAAGARSSHVGEGPDAWTGDLSPIDRSEWSYERAAHLIERAGFGATPVEIERLAEMSPEAAVDRLVDYEAVDNSHVRPFAASPIWDPAMDPFPKSRAEAVRIARENGEAMGAKVLPEGEPRHLQPVVNKFFYGLRSNAIETQRLALWWGERMVTTNRPLEEKLTLFWHGHFATGNNKVRDARMMHRQNEMLRARASGSFRDLLLGILKDPAMLVYLDNGENVKGHPNENFGRELLELFSMGVGNYTELDIREGSRAFTGWTNDVLEFKFDAEQHDFGEKTFLGRTGTWDGGDIIDIILAQPVTAQFIAGKLYRYFVRDEIDPAVQTQLGEQFYESGFELKPLLRTIFLSRDFYGPDAYATQIKSPVHLVASTYRKLDLTELPTIPDFGRMTAELGQSLFGPPNVAGWAGGRTWITPALLLQRGNLFRYVLFPDADSFRAPDRRMPSMYASVGRRLEQGLNITAATKEGDAESNMLADRDEDYNTRYGGYMGYVMAYERLKLVPRHVPDLDLTQMLADAGANTVDEIADHFIHRFLRVPLDNPDRAVLVEFLRDEMGSDRIETRDARLEAALRGLLYLILSTPEYQLA